MALATAILRRRPWRAMPVADLRGRPWQGRGNGFGDSHLTSPPVAQDPWQALAAAIPGKSKAMATAAAMLRGRPWQEMTAAILRGRPGNGDTRRRRGRPVAHARARSMALARPARDSRGVRGGPRRTGLHARVRRVDPRRRTSGQSGRAVAGRGLVGFGRGGTRVDGNSSLASHRRTDRDVMVCEAVDSPDDLWVPPIGEP